MTTDPPPGTGRIILASGSRYRKQLLASVVPGFESISPDIDESPETGELPAALASRLARAKAMKVATDYPGATVIGSDQVASLEGRLLSKPGNHERAVSQLTACSGKTVKFYTAVHVVQAGSGIKRDHINLTEVHFRQLTATEIEDYLQEDKPYDCAGSFRSEGLGASLFDSVEMTDPTALIGLPMEWLAGCLRELGVATE